MQKLINKINFLYGPLNHLSVYRFLPVFLKKTIALILSMAILIGTPGVIYLFNPWTRDTQAAWFDDSWAYRKAIEIATHTASENTVYINLTGADDIDTDTLTTDKLQADCGDMRFTKQNGELLPYYIVSGCDSVDTVVHVYFDTMPAGAQTIYFYYGNPSAVNGTEAADFSTEAANYTFGTAGSEEKGTAPTLYWKFNDGTIGTAEDSTTNGLDGTHNNTPTIQTENFCISQKCLLFDGANDENVSKADDPMLDFVAADNFTVSAWVKRNGASSANNFILTKAQSGYTGYKLYQDASGDYCFDVSDGTNTDTACTSAVDFDDDQWHFVQGVKAATTSITLYVDGKQRAQDASIAATGTLANTGTFYVGVDLDGTSNEWLGFIDEVKVYRDNTARSAAQVQADYTSRSTGEGASAVLGASDANENLSSGLVGYWKMDETSWTSDCSTEEVLDASGTSNNGESCPNADANDPLTGKFGNAGDFDGTNDYVSVDDADSLDIGNTLTVSAWIKASSLASRHTIFSTRNAAGAGSFDIEVGSGTGTARVGVATPGVWNADTGNNAVATGSWYHIVYTRNGTSTGSQAIYVNGVKQTLTTDTIVSFSNNTAVKLIGAITTTGQFFTGSIDEVRIYNRALSNSEVSQLYNFAPGPVGYWNFEEKTGTSANDRSGNGNTGTLTNTPTWTTGKYGASINFAGSDQHVTRADDADFDFADDADFTFSAWVRHATTSASEIVLSKFNEAGYKIIMTDDGDFTCALDYDSTWTPTDSATSSAATYDDNNWHYISCVKSGASTLRLYIDGVLIETDSTLTATNTVTNSDPLYIGIDADATSNDWLGQIDEVKIYNYARSSKQVVEDMNGGHPSVGSPVGSAFAHWKFDEGADNTCSGGTNDACNSGSMGSTLDGANTGASWTQSGKFGRAYDFEKTDVDYINIADNNAFSFGNSTTDTPFSLSLWFNAESINTGSFASTADFLIAKDHAAAVREWNLVLGQTNDIAFSVWDDSTGGVLNISYEGISTSTWYHAIVTYDGSAVAGGLKMYLNGNPVTTTNGSSGSYTAMENGSEAVRIGNWTHTTNLPYDGLIDEVKIYNYALTADEVKLDMNRGASEVLGALSDNSTYQKQAANQEYCVPGDTTSCASPVGRWNFEEGTSTVANDTSGNANTGTLTSGPTYTTGKAGKAINFDGSDDHVLVADNATLDFAAGASFTLEGWFKHTTQSSGQDFMISKFAATGYKLYMESDGDMSCGIDDDGTTFPEDSVTSTAATYDDNLWHHVACVKSADTSLTLYIDGISVGTADTSISATGTLENADPFYIGIDEDGTSNAWLGQLDNVKVFNYARTPAQVAWDYNKGAPLVHWKFDECQGTAANNSAGTTYNGAITIGATGTYTSTGTCTSGTSTHAWAGGSAGAGVKNYALSFDGTNDYVDSSTLSGLGTLVGGDRSFTTSTWAQTGTAATRQSIVGDWTSGADNESFSHEFGGFGQDSSHITVHIKTGSGLDYIDSNVTYSTSTWYHIVQSYNGTSGARAVYVNGILRNSDTVAGTLNIGDKITVGRGGAWSSIYLNGKVDDFRIYNYTMTTTQVKELYNLGAVNFGPSTGAP